MAGRSRGPGTVRLPSTEQAGELSSISSTLAKIDAEHRQRKTIGAFAVAAALLAALLLYLLNKTYT